MYAFGRGSDFTKSSGSGSSPPRHAIASWKLAWSSGYCFSLTLTPVAKLSRRVICSRGGARPVRTAVSKNRSGLRWTAAVASLSSGCRKASALRCGSLTRVDGV